MSFSSMSAGYFPFLKGTKYGWLLIERDIKSLFLGSPVVERSFLWSDSIVNFQLFFLFHEVKVLSFFRHMLLCFEYFICICVSVYVCIKLFRNSEHGD